MGILDARNLADVVAEASRNGTRHTHSVQSLFNAAKSPPADNDVFQFDAATKLWTPTSVAGLLAGGSVNDLSDVTISSVADADTLEYDTGSSAWINTAKNYTVATSSTRPATTEGRAIYETDTDEFLIYHGSQWRRPWNQPWGIVFYAETTDNTTQTATFDVASLTTGSVTPVANRRWRFTAHLPIVKTTGTGTPALFIRTGTGAEVGAVDAEGVMAVSDKTTLAVAGKVITTTASAVTYKCVVDVGSNGVQPNVSATYPGWFLIEDIGPNGSPA